MVEYCSISTKYRINNIINELLLYYAPSYNVFAGFYIFIVFDLRKM